MHVFWKYVYLFKFCHLNIWKRLKILIQKEKKRKKEYLTFYSYFFFSLTTWNHLSFKGCSPFSFSFPFLPKNSSAHTHTQTMLFHIQEMDDALVYDGGDEDYIELELSSSPSTQTREFEFQMSTAANGSATATSPADELFYKGKLLPLYLPPRRQMVQTLLAADTGTTPSDSCNISPPESCRVSCDLSPDDYFFEWSNELNTFINHHHPTKTSWPRKLKLINHSILRHKLKASKAYLKSLFVKSHVSSAKPNPNPLQTSSEHTHPTIASIMNSINEENGQRRSFSRAIKRQYSPTSTSSNSSSGSSSFSLNSNGNLQEQLQCLRRSSSATEIECSIEGAIAHCKKSHQH